MEENKQQLAALKRLLDLPHNKQCADCMGGGGAARASWASINTGVFICMRCAGIHRGLGVHVSKVCPSSPVTKAKHGASSQVRKGKNRQCYGLQAKSDGEKSRQWHEVYFAELGLWSFPVGHTPSFPAAVKSCL